jgi:hypothetical protein
MDMVGIHLLESIVSDHLFLGGKNCSSACVDLFPKVSMRLMSALTPSQELQSFLGDAPLTRTDLTDVFTRVFLGTDHLMNLLSCVAEVDKKLERFEYEGSTATTVFIWQAGGTSIIYYLLRFQ